MSRRDSASRSQSAARSGGARQARPRSDGKVDISCPQCGAAYRVHEEHLDQKIECASCHRVFFAKTTVGKRAKAPDHTKTYMMFGAGALVVILGFIVMSSGKEPASKPVIVAPAKPIVTRGTHPRTLQIVKWAQAMGSDNRLVIKTHNDMAALAKALGTAAGDDDAAFAAIGTHDSTRFLRELVSDSATLSTDEAMTAEAGQAIVYVTPKPGTDDWLKDSRGELDVAFRMDGEQVKVTGWTVRMAPVRNPKKPDPSKSTFAPNKDIAKPEAVEFTDSTGVTRKRTESTPTAVPHWDKATPAQQAMADKVVADLLASAAPDAPGGLFARATLSVQTLDDRKAVVPRVLNAMFELYGDVNTNNLKVSQLDRALETFTGTHVGYPVADGADPAKDKAARESCVRQWFAFWWRYSSGDLAEFLDLRENLDEPIEQPPRKND